MVGEGALKDPKQRRGRNGLFEVHILVPFGEGHVLEKSAGEDSFSSDAAFHTKRSSAVTFP
jgi:hypothetical protein